jgi:predicted nuclease of predicted toxin-antitoxin system
VPGRFPILTDENIDGPVVRGLRQRGWDVKHATEEFGERTVDNLLFEYAVNDGRVFVSTDGDALGIALRKLAAGQSYRLIWWEQVETQNIPLRVVLDAFEAVAEKENAFAYPIEFLNIPR